MSAQTDFIACRSCGELHAWIRYNVSIVCTCGKTIDRTEQRWARNVCTAHRAEPYVAEKIDDKPKAEYYELRCPTCHRSRGIRRLLKEVRG